MSKFLQLADDIASDLREMDNDADELNARRLKAKESARLAVNVHHAAYNRIEGGIEALEQVGRDLMGSNSDKNDEDKAKLDKLIADEKAKIDKITADKIAADKIALAQASAGESAKLGEDSGATSDSSFLSGV